MTSRRSGVLTAAFLLGAFMIGAAYFTRLFLPDLSGQEKKKEKAPDAVADVRILIVRHGTAASEHANTWRSHASLLWYPLILERAVKKGDLTSLKSFAKVADPVAEIQARLSITRDPESDEDGTIIALTYRGPVADDNVKVLAAILESYQEFLDNTYRGPIDEVRTSLKEAREVLRKDLAEAEKNYTTFLRNNGPSYLGREMSTDRLRALDLKKTELLIRQIELRVELKQCEGDAARPGLQVVLHEWATSTGFDKLPKAIQEKGHFTVYKEYLKEKLDRVNAIQKALDEQIAEEKEKQ